MMDFFTKQRKFFLAFLVFTFVFSSNVMVSYAAYPVTDHKAIAETIKILNNAKEQLAKLQEWISIGTKQLDIWKKQMTDITDGTKGILKEFDDGRNKLYGMINEVRQTYTGFMKPVTNMKNLAKETETKFKETFTDLAGLNLSKIVAGDLANTNAKIDSNVSTMNKEALTEVSAIRHLLEQDNKELERLRELSRKTTGQRDLEKIGNEIKAVEARIQGHNAKLVAIQATTETVKHQAEMKKAENTAEYNFSSAQKFAADVVKGRKELLDLPNGYPSRKALMEAMQKKHWGQ